MIFPSTHKFDPSAASAAPPPPGGGGASQKASPPPGGSSTPPPGAGASASKKASGAGAGAPPSTAKLIWHGEDDDEPLADWLVDDMLYRVGVALMAGQWGTYKTFVAIDLPGSLMTMTAFAGRAARRQGGTLFIAAEGQAQVRVRLEGLAIEKVSKIDPGEGVVKIDPKKMPFAWVKRSPPLSDPKALIELRALIEETKRNMHERFGLPLVFVVIDALMPAAHFKDADDTTEARQVMDRLAMLARETDVLIMPIDHFGKDISTGTRNSSAKEDAADTILALLADRALEGTVTNPRMAIRKVKGSAQGIVINFTPREVIVKENKDGALIKTLVIDWMLTDDQRAPATKKAWSKALLIFKRALDKTLGDNGRRLRPFPDGPEVLAVLVETLRAEFMKASPSPTQKAKDKAFERALDKAAQEGLTCVREIDAESFKQFIWRLDVK